MTSKPESGLASVSPGSWFHVQATWTLQLRFDYNPIYGFCLGALGNLVEGGYRALVFWQASDDSVSNQLYAAAAVDYEDRLWHVKLYAPDEAPGKSSLPEDG